MLVQYIQSEAVVEQGRGRFERQKKAAGVIKRRGAERVNRLDTVQDLASRRSSIARALLPAARTELFNFTT